VLDAASIIIQYHFFLAFALAVAGLAGAGFRELAKRKLLPGFFRTLEYLIIAALVIVYVFANV